MSALSEQYALALFGLAREQKRLDDMQSWVSSFASVYREEKAFFDHPGVASNAKLDVVLKAYPQGLFSDFIGVLMHNNRLALLPEITTDLDALIAAQDDKMYVTLTSAKPLSEARITQIQAQLQKQYNRHVIMDVIVDASLIGGLRYAFDGKVLNDSISQNLRSLHHRLVK